MAGIIDDLMQAYGTPLRALYPNGFNSGATTSSGSSLLDALSGSQTGYIPPSMPQGMAANPQIIQITPDEAANAIAQQGGAAPAAAPQPDPARIAALQQQAAQQQATAPAPAPQIQAPVQAPIQTQQVAQPNVASVSAAPGFPSPSDYNADGTQALSAQSPDSGVLGALAGAGQAAVRDPSQSKGLLSALGDYAQGLGDKLKSLSPAASQGLLAAGLSVLANNDGRHNMSQLLGEGGIAGINQYQAVTQNTIGNQLARQKLAQDLYEKQQTNALGWYNANTNRAKDLNTIQQISPENSYTTPGMQMAGQAPLGGGNASQIVKTTRDVQLPDGTVVQQGFNLWGQPVGQPTSKSTPYVGPLNDSQQKTVNDANTTANQSAFALTKTQNYMKQLMPTIQDPNDPTKTIPNPDYIPVTGGVAATVQNELNKITGGQTQSQLLRNEIQQNVRLAMLQGYKGGIGGRLTNTDVNLLQQGMPPDNASGSALLQYLNAYSHLQEDQATHDALTAKYLTANRGDTSPLHSGATVEIDGKRYGAGSTMQQVLSRQSPVQSGDNVDMKQAQSIVQQAQAAARNGDASAQAALKQRGLSW